MYLWEVLGVVLAGGASRRMGLDKARLEVGGRTLVERAVAALQSNCAEVAISMQAPSQWPDSSLRTIHDLRPAAGPLAGLESALLSEAESGRSAFLLACDLPYVTAEVVRYVLQASDTDDGSAAVIPSVAGRRQPLCGLYRAKALETVRHHLDSGRRAMHRLLDAIAVLEIPIGPDEPFFRPDLFHNLNRPEDLAELPAESRT